MRYSVRTAGQVDMPAVSEFLLAGEERWTGLTEKLIFRGRLVLPKPPAVLRLLLRGSELAGVIFNDGKGYTFPALIPPFLPADIEALQRGISDLPKIRTLLGDSRIVDHAVEARRHKPDFRVDYLLMVRSAAAELPNVPRISGLEIVVTTPSMARGIYPLQKAYEIEEVLLEPDRFNPLICMSHLRETLKTQLVCAAIFNRRLVGKAGTNARGVNWAQIGGVFTQPDLRGRGIGRSLMSEVLAKLKDQQIGATLFVKPANRAACTLYRRLGFIELGPFSIAYYLR